MSSRTAAIGVLVLLGLFWVAVAIAGSANPHYSHSRDYISSLAAVGARHPWLGMLAIAAVGVAFALTSVLLRHSSSTAAVAVAAAGVGFVIAAFVRLRCAEGAAFCAVGRRESTDLENTRGYAHEGAVIGSTLLLVIGMIAFGIALFRRGQRAGGVASLLAAGATVVAFASVSGDTPGTEQRVWIAVMMAWTVGVSIWALARPTGTSSTLTAIR